VQACAGWVHHCHHMLVLGRVLLQNSRKKCGRVLFLLVT
jgi:hypothetical protein